MVVGLYMLTVVYLVKRQMKKVEEEGMTVAVTNERGETMLKDVDKVMDDQSELLLWVWSWFAVFVSYDIIIDETNTAVSDILIIIFD